MAFYALKNVKSKLSSTTSAPKMVIEPLTVIRGASLAALVARNRVSDDKRAEGAACCLDGKAIVLSTITTLCDQFNTNYPAIIEARGQLGNHHDEDLWLRMLLRGWINCTADQRAIFVAAKEREVWTALEHAADHHQD